MIARVALVLRRLAMDVHPSDGATMKIFKITLQGVRVSTTMLVGVFSSFGCPHINLVDVGWQPTLGTLIHLLPSFPFPLGFP
jgi:hypothetical protein